VTRWRWGTYHASLLNHERSQTVKHLRELVYATLDFDDFPLAFLNEGLLVSEFVWR
jgi:hypothetical protein